MSKKWRCAVLGAGMVGEWHTKVLSTLDCAKLVAVCDRRVEKIKENLAKNGIEGVHVYPELSELLEKEGLCLGGSSGIMISNIVVSLFGAAYNWPLGAAISLCMLLIIVGILTCTERLEKRWGRL